MFKRRNFVTECRIYIPLKSKLCTKIRSEFKVINMTFPLDIRNLHTYKSIGKCLENGSYFPIFYSSLFFTSNECPNPNVTPVIVESQLYLFMIRTNY